ncbi:MAG: NAD(P)H-hydrate dehydratase [Actinobacteria bacterium]|nr:NAD(P)H-hydrate dehydratase [Actinomycetota bacterium]
MRSIDEKAQLDVGIQTLINRAGSSLARVAVSMLGGTYGRRITVLFGKGNNGNDGRTAGRLLGFKGAKVSLVETSKITYQIGAKSIPREFKDADLVIDSAYGLGFKGEYNFPCVPHDTKVLACDIPSGINADTGEICGMPAKSDATVTFGALKPGLLLGEAPLYCGNIVLSDIGLDTSNATMHLLEDLDVAKLLPQRSFTAHKWNNAVLVVGGSKGMMGSADLTSRAALRSGAGMVRLGIPGYVPFPSEVVSLELPPWDWEGEVLDVLDRFKALVIGPGLGRDVRTVKSICEVVEKAPLPVVIDADGLYGLGTPSQAVQLLLSRRAATILTPHQREFERLTGVSLNDCNSLELTMRFARQSSAVVLLKGPTTIVAAPDGEVLFSTAGPSSLATAGTGDVLSGIIGAFLARGIPPLSAAGCAAQVHGSAARLGYSDGLLAGDLLDLIPLWFSLMAGRD